MYNKILLMAIGVILIAVGIFGHGAITDALTYSDVDEWGNTIGSPPQNEGAAIVTGLLVGLGVALIVFTSIKNPQIVALMGLISGALATAYYWNFTGVI